MKHITGNLSDTGYEELIRNFTPGEEDTLDKKLPHVGKSKDVHFLGNCIFTFVFNILESNTEIQIIPSELIAKKVIIDGSLVNLDGSNYTFQETGEHVVQILASDIWTSIEGTFINGWENLVEIVFPNSIESFDCDSIVDCSGLEKLKFGKKLREINGDLSALDLGEIEISKRNRNLRVLDGKYIVSYEHPDILLGTIDCNIPTDPRIKKLGKSIYAEKILTNFVIPGNIEELGDGSFEGSTFIGSLELGEGIKKIDSKAFYNIDITGLDILVLRPNTPPTIIDPEYFDLRDVDGNGNPISGIEFEVVGNIAKYLEDSFWNNCFDTNYFFTAVGQYLTLIALEEGTFTLTIDFLSASIQPDIASISYSINNGESWITTNKTQDADTIITTPLIPGGKKVIWKGIGNNLYASGGPGAKVHFSSTGNFNVSGNPASLCTNGNFSDIPTTIQYCRMFTDCNNLISARNFVIPPSSRENCYSGMFYNCTSLKEVSSLPNINLPYSACSVMFYGCTSLEVAPSLPATTLNQYCYQEMFKGCTSLITPPELPARTMASGCYGAMFYGCISLETAPELPATTLADYCYGDMFKECISLRIAPELPATTLAGMCYGYLPWRGSSGGMFCGCTSLEIAPELPATTLADGCYYGMFTNCRKLRYIKMLAQKIPANNCLSSWVSGVSSTGVFVMNPLATWTTTGTSGVPSGWTVEYNWPENYDYFTTEAINSSVFTLTTDSVTNGMESFDYSIDNGTTWTSTLNVKNQVTTISTPTIPPGGKVLWRGVGTHMGSSRGAGYLEGITISSTGNYKVSGKPLSFLGCRENLNRSQSFVKLFYNSTTLIDAANLKLPNNITDNCYAYMFYGCTNLKNSPALPATDFTNITAPYRNMFENCSSLRYIKMLATDIPNTNYYHQIDSWTNGVSASGVFVKNPNATWTFTGVNGVPDGWNVVNEVEYLQPNGQAYIDTGIILPDRVKFKYKFSTHIQYGFFFGNYVSENHNTFRVIDSSNGNGNLLLYPNTRASSGATSIPVGDLNTVHTIDMSQTQIKYDDTLYSGQINTTQGTANSTNLVIFANKSGGSVQNLQHCIYFFQIWKNNELVRDFIPVRQGTTGYLCDKVSGQLFGNSGSGSFTLGPDL